MKYQIQHIQSFSKLGKRTLNEDAVYPFLENSSENEANLLAENLYMVCDGVGGLDKGEIASELACKRFAHYFYESEPNENEALSPLYMQHAVKWVESGLDAYLRENMESAGMGTTVALLYFNEIGANIAWVGDSRVYHIRAGKILYQTQDHSFVNELIKLGQITPEQARTHRQKNVILRAIQGSTIPTEADIHCIPWSEIQKGDYFLLCTDGITETWQNPDIEEVFAHALPNSQIIEYLDKACELNSRDNFTCSLIEIGQEIVQESPIIAPIEHTVIENSPIVEIPQVLVEHASPVIENAEIATPIVDAPKIETPVIKDVLSATAPVIPTIEEKIVSPPVAELPKKETPIIEKPSPQIPTLEMSAAPITENKGGRAWLWALLLAVFIVGGACAWMYNELYGKGEKNELFEKYYKVAEEKVKYCEQTGKCSEAEGLKNQARAAQESAEEIRLVDSLEARIRRKEADVRKKSTLNSPKELTDKDKEDTRAEGATKSQTPTPKSPANVAPSKSTTSNTSSSTPKTLTSTKTTTTTTVTTIKTPPTTLPKETPVSPTKEEVKPKNMPISPNVQLPPKTTTTTTSVPVKK